MVDRHSEKNKLSVGIIGAGLGGLIAAIAIVDAGASVTILEAATELGEACFKQLRSGLNTDGLTH